MDNHYGVYVAALILITATGCLKQNSVQQTSGENDHETTASTKDTSTKDSELKTCGAVSMSAEDAEKWDCAPSKGYWCTAPSGCPFKDSIFPTGMPISYAYPIPQEEGYQYDGAIQSIFDNGIIEIKGGWKCTLNEGCLCGSDKIAKYNYCYGDIYEASGSLTETCNKHNCSAFCRNGKCFCGDADLMAGIYESITCRMDQRVCAKATGCQECQECGKKYAQNEKWYSFDIIYHKCILEQGCKCDTGKCAKSADCHNKSCWHEPDEDNKSDPVCETDEGCACGSQLCPRDFTCSNNMCVYDDHGGYDATPHTIIFYCDKPEGCSCGSHHSTCPQGAVCGIRKDDIDWSDEVNYVCMKIDDKYKDSAKLFEYLKDVPDHFYSKYYGSDVRNIIFDETYYSVEDAKKGENYYLNYKDGKKYNTYIVCSKPGCDCHGVPLKEGYVCVEQSIVFDYQNDELVEDDYHGSDYGACAEPYRKVTHNRIGASGSCELSEIFIEQVCSDPNGCNCGEGKIPKGDICVDGHGRCSTNNERSGCVCGNSTIQNKKYDCYSNKLICQGKNCPCHGKNIQFGDICETDKVICGENSTTKGCICGDKQLRDGYRCLKNKQRCTCKIERTHNSEDDDVNQNNDEMNCTCTCGDKQIKRHEICLDNDTPFSWDSMLERIDDDNYFSLSCGDRRVIVPNAEIFVDYHYVDIDNPDNIELYCTCGTYKPAPGDGYWCALDEYQIGNGSEWRLANTFKGWQCHKYEGCECGIEMCQPGDLCNIAENGTKNCEPYKTFDGICGNHVLPPSLIHYGSYACYDKYSLENNVKTYKYAPGWYCSKPEGCVCGAVKCNNLQMCLEPGYCAKNSFNFLDSSLLNTLRPPHIFTGRLFEEE